MLITIYGIIFEIFSFFEKKFSIFLKDRALEGERLCSTIAYFENKCGTE